MADEVFNVCVTIEPLVIKLLDENDEVLITQEFETGMPLVALMRKLQVEHKALNWTKAQITIVRKNA